MTPLVRQELSIQLDMRFVENIVRIKLPLQLLYTRIIRAEDNLARFVHAWKISCQLVYTSQDPPNWGVVNQLPSKFP